MDSKIINNTVRLARMIGRHTSDGLENILTGIGINGKDKRLGGQYKYVRRSQGELETLHDTSDLAKIVVNKIPEEATKNWINHSVNKEDGGIEKVNEIVDEDERLAVQEKFEKAMSWANLYGGAGVYISVDDGLDPSEPLNLDRISRVNSLTVLHRHELQRAELNDDIDDPNFGLPEAYTISGRTAVDVPTVHHTRIIRFEGSPLSEQGFKNNDYWNDSVLTVIADIIRDYDAAYAGVFNALQDFDVDILKLKNLADICGGDDDDLITARLRLMQLSKSIMSAIVIDAEDESFEKLQRAFTNIDKVLDKCDKRLQTASGLPHTVLFGEGSTGSLGAGGESEENTLNSAVKIAQNKKLRRQIDRLFQVIMSAKQGPTGGDVLKSWSWSFNSLSEENPKTVAETRKLTAETDNLYFTMGALSSDEIAESRFGGDEYSSETNIDLDARGESSETKLIDPTQTKKELEGIDPDIK